METNNDITINTSPKVIKKRIHKKKPVEQQVEPAVTFVTEEEIDEVHPVIREEPPHEIIALKDDDDDSLTQPLGVNQILTLTKSPTDKPVTKKVKAPLKPKATTTVATESSPNTEEPNEPVVNAEEKPKKTRAPRKPKATTTVVTESSPNTEEPNEPVVNAEEKPKKARAPRKPKATTTEPVCPTNEVVPLTPVSNTTQDAQQVFAEPPPIAKKAKAPRKPKSAASPNTDEVTTKPSTEPVVKKAKAPRKTNVAPEPKTQVNLHGPENPTTADQFFQILRTFIKQNTRYTALAEKPDGTVYPIFLKITGDYNEDTETYPCEFYKAEEVEDEGAGYITSNPIWTSVLEKGQLTKNSCFNILPFDKEFHYTYMRPLKVPTDEE